MSIMNKSNSAFLSQNLLNNLNSFRGHLSINELEEIIVSLVFLKFIKEESLKNDFFKFDNSLEIYGDSSTQNYNNQFIGETLQNTFRKIELDNPILNGLFSSFNFSYESKNIDHIKVIETLVRLISELD